MANIQTVPLGGTVFIGEQGLDVSAATGNYTTLSFYTGSQTIGTSAPAATVPVGNAVSFYVSPSDFSGKTGNWYLGNTATVGLVILDPSISITAKDTSDLTNDISGKSVTAGTGITFRIESNLNQVATQRGATTGIANIRVRSPDGTTYTKLFSDTTTTWALNALMIDGNPTIWPGTWNTGAKDASGNRYYKAGSYSFWIELALNQIKDNYNYAGKTYTDQKTVTIASDTLSMTSNTASVVRGTGFTVTILGSPNTVYKMFIKNIASGEQAPTFVENQEGVSNVVNYSANVLTSNSGSRSVGFATNQDTKSKSWTIRAENGTKNDEISVRVEKGHVSIVAAGSNNYYLGDEIKLTGTNTETSTVYLFMTGPNLPSSGGQMADARTAVVNGDGATFAQADVLSDNTWKFDWSTDGLNVDSGSYTVYAVATPSNKDHLSDTQYASTSVTIRKPYITADMPSMVAAGDKIIVRGDAAASPNVGVAVWILGKNYVFYDTTSVEDDGTYELEISSGDTSNLYPGQYYVVVQHPMYNGKFDTWPSSNLNEVYGTYPVDGNLLFRIGGAGSLQGTDAAEALRQALDAGANDDIYANLQFVVAQPTINILPISQKMVGDKFTIKGTTNLAVDSEVQVDIVSSSFKPESKTNASEFSGSSGTVKVVRGVSTTLNEFSFDVDTGRYKSDEYIVQAASITTSAYGSALFNVVPYVAPTPTPTPTPVPTPIPTTVVTTVPTPIPVINTTTPTPTPQGAPGFGAVIAIVGLVGVAFLVSRKE
jgi:PGF-CTERM protein